MQFYASPTDEARAIRRAASRSNCAIRTLEVNGSGRLVGSLACGSGWDAARLLIALAEEDARTPGARRLAGELRGATSGDEHFARAIHAFVKENVRFEREVGEIFQSGGFTLAQGFGDCDDHFRLAYALARAGGLPAALGILHHGTKVAAEKQGPAHAAAVLGRSGKWAETTIDAAYGEHPARAARRLGLTDSRDDIAKEVVIMTARDLPPVPEGFGERNPAEQVAEDTAALRELGYLSSNCPLEDAAAPEVRAAVAEFQRATGLLVDGLLGPVTRAKLRHGAMSIGAISAPVAVRLTRHLSESFFDGVRGMAARMRAAGATIEPEDLLLVWLAESGISNIQNRQGAPYAGLNQMGPDERRASGFSGTMGDWLALSPAQQLPFVERFYANATGGHFDRLRDAASLYLVNFLPAFASHAGEPDFILARVNPEGPQPGASELEWRPWREAHRSDWYAWNRGFDTRRDGTIRVRDLGASLEAAKNSRKEYWAEVVGRLASPSPSAIGAGVVALLLGAGGVAAWAAHRWGLFS